MILSIGVECCANLNGILELLSWPLTLRVPYGDNPSND